MNDKSSHVGMWNTSSLLSVEIPAVVAGVRGCKHMDTSTDKSTSSMDIPMYLASERNKCEV